MKHADQAFSQRRRGGYVEGAAQPDDGAVSGRSWRRVAEGGADAGHHDLAPTARRYGGRSPDTARERSGAARWSSAELTARIAGAWSRLAGLAARSMAATASCSLVCEGMVTRSVRRPLAENAVSSP